MWRKKGSAHDPKHTSSSVKHGGGSVMQQDNGPKHTAKTTKDFIREKNWKVLDWPSQPPDHNPIEHAFHLLKRRLEGNPPWNKQLKEAAVKAWKSITKKNVTVWWCQWFAGLMQLLQQGICYQIVKVIYYQLPKYSLFQYFCSPKNWVVRYQRCYAPSTLTHLGVNTR